MHVTTTWFLDLEGWPLWTQSSEIYHWVRFCTVVSLNCTFYQVKFAHKLVPPSKITSYTDKILCHCVKAILIFWTNFVH